MVKCKIQGQKIFKVIFLSQFQQRKKARKHADIESRLENEQINVKGVGKYCLATQSKSSFVSNKRDFLKV